MITQAGTKIIDSHKNHTNASGSIKMEQRTFGCPVEATLAVIGGKWKPLILFYLLQGTKRFGELKRMLPQQVTQQMLTLQLRELERDGIVLRQVYAEVPPKVEYSLTERGRSLEPLLLLMLDWGQQFLQAEGRTAGTKDALPVE
jgi:DNA-binding HxlR family transcriptional regulator